jgi:hypothetical protein
MLKTMFGLVRSVARAPTLLHSKGIGNSYLIYIQLKNHILSLFMNINKWKKETFHVKEEKKNFDILFPKYCANRFMGMPIARVQNTIYMVACNNFYTLLVIVYCLCFHLC